MPILFTSNKETGHIKWNQGAVSFIYSLGTSGVHDHLVHIHHTFPYFNSIQLFHTFLCNSKNYHPKVMWMTQWHCCTRPKADGNSASDPQHRRCDSVDGCTEKYEIVVLLPNSELTKVNNKRDADAFRLTEYHGGSGSLNS